MGSGSDEHTRGRALVLGLLHLVGDSAHGTRCTVGERAVAGNVTLGLLLVALLGSLSRL